MHAAEARGELPEGTAQRWEDHTPKGKKLPEKVKMKKEAFWAGFEKAAKESAEALAGDEVADMAEGELDSSNEKKLKWNPEGGVDPRSPEAMQVHEAVDMVTLPEAVEGASCGTCEHMRILDPVTGAGFCTNPAIKLDVTRRMLCSEWSAPGVYRASEALDPASPMAAQMVQEAQGIGAEDPAMAGDPSMQPEDPGAPEGAVDPSITPGQDQGQSPQADVDPAVAEKAPEPSNGPAKKEPAPKKGQHTVNVNIGGEKQASFWSGFDKSAGSLSTARVDRFLNKMTKNHDTSMINDVHKRVFANDSLKRHRLGTLKNRAMEQAEATQAKGGFKGTAI